MKIRDIIKKADTDLLSHDDLVALLQLPPEGAAAYEIMVAANAISRSVSGGQAEVHGQFALNLALCACNCKFCSFSAENGVFSEASELMLAEAVVRAVHFEREGANAIFIMTSADYDFGRFIEISREISTNLERIPCSSPMWGIDTGIQPETRKQSIGNCTHEPCIPGALAGANLFWAETGANPGGTY